MTHRLVPRNVCVVAQFLGINILDLIDKDLINKEPFLFLKDSFWKSMDVEYKMQEWLLIGGSTWHLYTIKLRLGPKL